MVLEARDRVGGRTEGGLTRDGVPLELGGQWIGATQNRMYDLVDELGLAVVPTWNRGQHLMVSGGRRGRLAAHRGAVPRLGPVVLADLFRGLRRFEALAGQVPLDRPWEAPDADALDGQSFETWIRSNLRTATGRSYFRVVTEAVFAAQSTDLSALHALFYAHSGSDLETLISVDGGAQQHRVVGGTHQISERLAQRLGDRVVLSSPVESIEHDRAGCRVRTGRAPSTLLVASSSPCRRPSPGVSATTRPCRRGVTSSPSASRPARSSSSTRCTTNPSGARTA